MNYLMCIKQAIKHASLAHKHAILAILIQHVITCHNNSANPAIKNDNRK